MRVSKLKDQFEKRKKQVTGQIEKRQKLILIVGIACLTWGLIRFFWVPAHASINLKTLLPTISNGTEFIVAGMVLLFGWYMTRRHKAQIIKSEMEAKQKKNEPAWRGEGDDRDNR